MTKPEISSTATRPSRRATSMGVLCAGISACAVVCAGSAAGVWEVLRVREETETAARARAEGAARGLAAQISLLPAGSQREMQTLLVNAAAAYGLSRCDVVDRVGQAVAAGTESGPALGESATTSVPLTGAAETMRLEVAAAYHWPRWASREAAIGLGAVGALSIGMLGWLGVRLRERTRSAGAIGRALVALHSGETSATALSVSPRFGVEAQAWNQLLAEREQQRKGASVERALESLGGRADGKSDLVSACDALWQGMVITDDRLTIRYANGAAAILLRGKRDGMLGASLEDFIADPSTRQALKAAVSGRHRTSAEWKQPESGGVLRLGMRSVSREDSGAHLLVMIEDITQQRVADEARNSFVAQATHELRTPLTNIRLYVEQMIDAGDEDKALRLQCVDVINQESRRLERIVGDMLSVSEIEAGSFRLRPSDVRLETLFEELKTDFAPQAKERELTLEFDLPPKLPSIRGDRDKIVLAVHNLVGNALKYTPKGGLVRVRVSVDAGSMTVEVSDTGIGIHPDESELIFEKFYRAKDKRVSNITGTGLGLALAREVVRLHGGDITVRSELNKGSTFTMSVPVMAEAA